MTRRLGKKPASGLDTRGLLSALRRANAGARALPGLSRQPIHVVYGGAHLFSAETPRKLASLARKSFLEHAPTSAELDRIFDLDPSHRVHQRVLEKLEREAIEDFRIDFEDGYGSRSNDEEDRDAERAARELAETERRKELPPFCGIRVKSLSNETAGRALRTLQIFLSSWISSGTAAGYVPSPLLAGRFAVTLPKVTSAAQAEIFAKVLGQLEKSLGLPPRSLRFEIMVELPELLMNRQGECVLPRLHGLWTGG